MHGRGLSVRELPNYLGHVLVIPSAPSGTLTMLRLASPNTLLWCYLLIINLIVGESDGRCVRASEPASGGHSTPALLLNPPLSGRFRRLFVGGLGQAM